MSLIFRYVSTILSAGPFLILVFIYACGAIALAIGEYRLVSEIITGH